ncbi:dynein, light chain, LC8-type 2b isoform X1 [Dunckerocampus dactyliophorus]|uniref:dynein, light chain, LC8-type 2b isoform X1 n=2 Tax=Dunckerocampus dactyliophorus TaxID=161453 RepID=UPI002406B3D3|nr:dynein, light chain, LC8-type 2b isoform X1 [Dunckerocampus dactyliophorus]
MEVDQALAVWCNQFRQVFQVLEYLPHPLSAYKQCWEDTVVLYPREHQLNSIELEKVICCKKKRELTMEERRSILKLRNSKANMTDKKAVIKNADMSEEMQQDAVDCAMQAMEKYNIEKDIAAYVKKEFDKKYNPTWHCIVGRNFGSYVTHETKHFIYFYLGQVAILLFKSG